MNRGDHHSPQLQRAWNKYGEDAFSFEVLEECSVEQLIIREQGYLDEYKPIFNCAKSASGGPSTGRKLTEETKKLMSEKAKGNKNAFGRILSAESREKISKGNKGKLHRVGPHTEETKRKISEAQKGKPRLYALGSKRSEETKKRMSEAQKKRIPKDYQCHGVVVDYHLNR